METSETPDTTDEIRALIVQLRKKKAADAALLKSSVQEAFERVKPINMIKSTLKEASTSKEVTNHLSHTALVFISSYLSKRLFMRMAGSPLKKLAGAVVLFAITNYVAKHPEKVKAVGLGIFNLIRGKSRKRIE
jgi:hypothetical protein